MGSQILRPKSVKHQESAWLIQGPWGRRRFEPMSRLRLYQVLHRELIESGVLPESSPVPSNQNHGHVTMAVMQCSWSGERWISGGTPPGIQASMRKPA